MTCRIVVVGSINMDLVARVPRLPTPGETVIGRDLHFIPGGKGANQAVAAARLGAETTLCGRLGDDAFSATLRAGLEREGVETSRVLTTTNTASGVAWIGVDASGENAITVIPGANGAVTPADVESWSPCLQSADVILLQLEIPLDAVVSTAERARRYGTRVILDVAPAPASALPEALWAADIVSPNQTEAAALTGIEVRDLASAERAARSLRDLGARCVVLKLGELGALVLESRHAAVHIPAPVIEPVDATAAGDAFTAALAVAWSEGMSLCDAARFACAAGACACLAMGAQPALPTRDAVLLKYVQSGISDGAR
jgi:ribokinase